MQRVFGPGGMTVTQGERCFCLSGGMGLLLMVCVYALTAFPEVGASHSPDRNLREQWAEKVPDAAWIDWLRQLRGGSPPQMTWVGSKLVAGIDSGQLVSLSLGLRGSNWFSGPGRGQWFLEEDGREIPVGGSTGHLMERSVTPDRNQIREVWRLEGNGPEVCLTWLADGQYAGLECTAERLNASSGAFRFIWEAELNPEAPVNEAWAGIFRGGMDVAWTPIPGMSDTFLAVSAWLLPCSERLVWQEIPASTLDDLKRFQRADRYTEVLPGKVLGWRVAAGARCYDADTGGSLAWNIRKPVRRIRVFFSTGGTGLIRYAVGDAPEPVLESCMVRGSARENAALLLEREGGFGKDIPVQALEALTDAETGITVFHPGRGHFYRTVRPDWAWLFARMWLGSNRPERAAAQIEPFLKPFGKPFLPGYTPVNAPALVNIQGEPVLPRIFDSFGDTAVAVLAAVDILESMPSSARQDAVSRWMFPLEQAVWSLYWQADPETGIPPPGFHPDVMVSTASEADWTTALAVLGAMEQLYGAEGRQVPPEWLTWQKQLDTRIRFRLHDAGTEYFWPVRAIVALVLARREGIMRLPDLMRLNLAGAVFPRRMVRSVLSDMGETLYLEEFYRVWFR